MPDLTERARELLSLLWPRTWPDLSEPMKTEVAHIMAVFALQETQRSVAYERDLKSRTGS